MSDTTYRYLNGSTDWEAVYGEYVAISARRHPLLVWGMMSGPMSDPKAAFDRTDRLEEKFLGLNPLGLFSATGTFTGAYSPVEPTDAYTDTLTMAQYASAVKVAKIAAKDPEVVRKYTIEQAEAWMKTLNSQAATAITGVFASETLPDTGYVCQASHAYPSGGTWSNYTTSALSADTLAAAIANIETHQSDAGILVRGSGPYTLIVPAAKLYKATEITDVRVGSGQVRGTSEMTGVQVVSDAQLDLVDANDWFVCNRDHGLRMRFADNGMFEVDAGTYVDYGRIGLSAHSWVYAQNFYGAHASS